jgi:hypothetical protein
MRTKKIDFHSLLWELVWGLESIRHAEQFHFMIIASVCLLGGDVELSYAVLGPDAFVVQSLKEQVRRHKDTRRLADSEVDIMSITEAVFESLGLDSELARTRTRRSDIARGRALVAWL